MDWGRICLYSERVHFSVVYSIYVLMIVVMLGSFLKVHNYVNSRLARKSTGLIYSLFERYTSMNKEIRVISGSG